MNVCLKLHLRVLEWEMCAICLVERCSQLIRKACMISYINLWCTGIALPRSIQEGNMSYSFNFCVLTDRPVPDKMLGQKMKNMNFKIYKSCLYWAIYIVWCNTYGTNIFQILWAEFQEWKMYCMFFHKLCNLPNVTYFH